MSSEVKPSLLVVDDEPSIREFLQIMLKREKMLVEVASNGKEALEKLQGSNFDLIISDIQMPEVSGIELLAKVKEKDPSIPVLMITAFASTETAVEAMRLGAFDYLIKPFKIEDVKIRIHKALENRVLVQDNFRMKKALGERYSYSNIIGSSPPMLQVFDMIKRIAPTPSNILIMGESGTGKELIAKAIHYNGAQAANPFIAVNCGAIPEELIESEMFGHKKGAFTTAIQDKKGFFEMAHNGTLFLDEVGEMPLSMQASLLRALAEGTFYPVGASEPVSCKVRLITATNRNLEEEVAQKNFREDLYFRLNVIQIKAPPLRQRREDIPQLCQFFLEKFAAQFGKALKSIPQETMDLLCAFNWPGNVRELENIMERMVALEAGNSLLPEGLPDHIREPLKPKMDQLSQRLVWNQAGVHLDEIVANVEREFLLKALDQSQGIKREAAKLLHLSMRSMRYRLEKYGLDTSGTDE